MPLLKDGAQPPRIVEPPPGPRSRELSARLGSSEAPGINTLVGGEPTLLWQEALGVNVLDVDGNRFLDLTSGFGVAAIGHRHPQVVTALGEQATTLLHGLGDVHAHPVRVELAEALCRLAPVDDPLVYWAVSGSDAVEIAVKTALLTTGRPAVLAFDPAYHGLSFGALALTSRPDFRQPFVSHLQPHLRRLPFGAPIRLIRQRLTEEPFAAVIVEPIVGREGVLLPPDGWLADLTATAHGAGALLIADEIFTGFGRTGHLFAVAHDGVRPDLLCCGKALGGGLPIAAVLGRRSLFEVWERQGEALHTGTFVAHPLACRTALAVLDILEREDLPRRALTLGERYRPRLLSWMERFVVVKEVRGRGLLWGVELTSKELARRWVERLCHRGILLLAGGPEGRVAQIVPPLTIPDGLFELTLDLLEAELTALESSTVEP